MANNQGLGLVIAFAQSKGGVGKTTTALGLALELAERGYKCTMLACDQNTDVLKVFYKNLDAENFTLVRGVNEENIPSKLEAAETGGADFVIIDTPGGMHEVSLKAVAASDYCFIPAAVSILDLASIKQTAKAVTGMEYMVRRKLHHALLWTRVEIGVSESREQRKLRKDVAVMADKGMELFNVSMIKRNVYEAMLSYGKTLYQLRDNKAYTSQTAGKKSQVEACIANFSALTDELLEKLVATGALEAEQPAPLRLVASAEV